MRIASHQWLMLLRAKKRKCEKAPSDPQEAGPVLAFLPASATPVGIVVT